MALSSTPGVTKTGISGNPRRIDYEVSAQQQLDAASATATEMNARGEDGDAYFRSVESELVATIQKLFEPEHSA